jgi:Flp pilus assembly protein TadG
MKNLKSEIRNPKSGLRRGSAVLEMGLTLALLLSLSFGTMEFGYFFYVKNTLQGAVREGVRTAILPGATNAQVTTSVAGVLNLAGLNSSATTLDAKFTLTLNPSDVSTSATGTNQSVQLGVAWSTIGVRPLGIIPGSKQVLATAAMRHE